MAGIAISFKAIKPKKLKIDGISREILFALQKEGREQKRLLNKTTAGFTGEKPGFESDIDLSKGGDAIVLTGPTGAGAEKWEYLNGGTRVRYALMSSDYQAGTKPGSLAGGRKRGRAVLIGRRAFARRGLRPRPGIQAREWTKLVTNMRKKPFTQAITKAMKAGAKGFF